MGFFKKKKVTEVESPNSSSSTSVMEVYDAVDSICDSTFNNLLFTHTGTLHIEWIMHFEQCRLRREPWTIVSLGTNRNVCDH